MERDRDSALFIDWTYCLFLFNYIWLLLYFIAFADSPIYIPLLGIVYGAHIVHNNLEFVAKYRFGYQKGFETFYHTPWWMKFTAWMMWCPILFVDSDAWRRTMTRQKWLFGKYPVTVSLLKLGSLVMFGIMTAIASENAFQWTVYALFLFHLISFTLYEIELANSIWIIFAIIFVYFAIILIGGFIIWLCTSWGCRSRRYVEQNGRYVEDEGSPYSFYMHRTSRKWTRK
jgi:hypothetical protein